MTKLIFVTHPSVDISATVPIDEWPVSEKGKEEVKRLLQQPFWKSVQRMYTSTEPKAYTVADEAAGMMRLVSERMPELKEVDRSSTGLLPFEEYMNVVEEFYQNPAENVRGWESAEHARQRMSRAIEEIMSRHANEVVAIVGHGMTGTLLACEIKKIAPSFAEDPKRTGCMMDIDWDNKVILSPWESYAEQNHESKQEIHKTRLR